MRTSDDYSTTETLNLCDLACPLPILKTKKAIREIPAGRLLTVLATDPGSVQDFENFCILTGHQLESHTVCDGVYKFQIRVKK